MSSYIQKGSKKTPEGREMHPGSPNRGGLCHRICLSEWKVTEHGTPVFCGNLPNRHYVFYDDIDKFLEVPCQFQEEAFGNESLIVVANDVEQASQIMSHLEGNLTGCIYSAEDGSDDAAYDQIAPLMRTKVGRLLNDKMPTGVAVASSMNHGGPYPATGHPGFTAVGIPASLVRFASLHCYDNVRPQRLPIGLQDANPTGETWRLVDGKWSTADLG